MKTKGIYYTLIGVSALVTSVIDNFFGGWDGWMQLLLILMAGDYLSGIACALVWKKSPKSKDGTFESRAGLKGLFRKAGILFAVLIAARLDQVMGMGMIRNTVVIFFCANDGLSIVENFGIMGMPMPKIIRDAFAALHKKGGGELPSGEK